MTRPAYVAHADDIESQRQDGLRRRYQLLAAIRHSGHQPRHRLRAPAASAHHRPWLSLAHQHAYDIASAGRIDEVVMN